MPSITSPPECPSASVHSRWVAAFAMTSPSRPTGPILSGPPLVRLRYGLVTRSHPFDGLVGMLQNPGFPIAILLPKLRGSDYYPGGTVSHGTRQPSLDARSRVCGASRQLAELARDMPDSTVAAMSRRSWKASLRRLQTGSCRPPDYAIVSRDLHSLKYGMSICEVMPSRMTFVAGPAPRR
jgi:hypothetical protein